MIAAVELVVLVAAGFALLAKPLSHAMRKQAEVHAFAPAAKKEKPKRLAPVVPQAPKLTRFQTDVLVLNGNGRNGAAGEAASKLRNLGYSIAATGNAPRTDYAATVVMYRAGYRAEGLRLAHDLHLKVVAPVDGLKPKQLLGAQIAVLLGAG
jgi:hypothetical protein